MTNYGTGKKRKATVYFVNFILFNKLSRKERKCDMLAQINMDIYLKTTLYICHTIHNSINLF